VPQNNDTIEYMRKEETPLTRENFLNLQYLGNPPDEIDPEVESTFPEQFRQKHFEAPSKTSD